MESQQMVHPHGHSHDQQEPYKSHDPHLAAEGEDHPEKMSMMKKVKAKARMIRDTITKHGHGHDQHQGDHAPDDHDLDEEDGEDDDIVEDPEVHGAPITVYESTAVISSATPVNAPHESSLSPGKSETKESGPSKNFETKESDPSKNFETKESDPSKTFETKESDSSKTFETKESDSSKTFETKESDPSKIFETKESDPSKTFVPGAQSKVNLEKPKGVEEDPHAPKDTPYGYTPSNYQTKVTDPIGAGNEEIGDTPIISSFGKMNIDDESKPKSQQNPSDIGYSSTGSHDQFSQETPGKPLITPQHPQTVQENTDTVKPGTPSLTKKISSATYSIADKAMSAKNVVASKLGYGEKDARERAHDRSSTTGDVSGNKQSSAAEYGKKIAATVTEKPTPVDEKVAEAATPVVSKKQGATTTTTAGSENVSADRTGQGRGGSVRDYLAEKLRPGEDDRALSEVISDALHKRKEEPGTRPMGKVTESEEVARRLGGTEDKKTDEREQSSSVNQAGEKSVVDKVKGTVGSWLGYGGDQSETAQQHSSHSQGEVGDDVQGREERRLKQSSN